MATVTGAATVVASAPPSQPTPTPTPAGAPAANKNLWVTIAITLNAKEPALTEAGTAPIEITASATARLPTAESGPVTVTGSVTMADHAPDPECTWSRTITKPGFEMTLQDSGPASVTAAFSGPEWAWTMTCPDPPRAPAAFRFPQFGAFQFGYYLEHPLGLTPGPVRIPTDIYAGYAPGVSGCLERWAVLTGSSSLSGDAEVDVWVYEAANAAGGGCLLPLIP
jgi:hypothetical protein